VTSPLPVLPVITVEAGFTASVPVGAGLVFLLDSATQGKLGTNTLGDTNTWTDITQWMISFTVTRASTRLQSPLYTWQAGGCTVLLDNSDGRFDPGNLTGPYVVAGATQVRPMLPIRISAVFAGITYRLFTGFAQAWSESPVTYEGGYSEVTVTAVDAFRVLAGVNLATQPSPVGAGDSTDGRANRILNAGSFYTDHRAVDTGINTNLQGTVYGSDVLSLLQLTADTEAGQLYADGNGFVHLRNRHGLAQDSRSVSVQAVFSDTPYPLAAVTSVTARCWGGGGGGGSANLSPSATGGSGGGGGEYASDTVTVTPGNSYIVVVGSAGTAGPGIGGTGGAGGVSTFTGDAGATVTAHGGGGGAGAGGAAGAGGTGSTNSSHNNGGAGGTGSAGGGANGLGGGGGGSGGTASAGNAGTAGGSGGAGGAAVAGGGAGGSFPGAGSQPGGGGAGGGHPGWAGAAGQVTLTWAGGTQTWSVPGTYQWTVGLPALAYASISRANDDTQLVNDAQITAAGSANMQEAADTNSEATFLFPRTYTRTDLLLSSDPEALSWAQFVVYLSRNAADRFDVLTIDPLADPASLYPHVLGREIGDRIQVWKTPAGAAQFSKDAFIAGITHAFDATTLTWQTGWTLQDASQYSTFLTLNDPVRGQLNTGALIY
jgi:hypothetical protein